MAAEQLQRMSSSIWSSSPEVSSLSLAGSMAYIAARFVALRDGEAIWDETHTRPADVVVAGQRLTVEALWPYLPRCMTGEQARDGLSELVERGVIQPLAGSYVFPGLGAENAQRFLDAEVKRKARRSARDDGELSAGQLRTAEAKREAATQAHRVTAFLSWFAGRHLDLVGAAYVPDKLKDRAVAKKLLAALDRRDLAMRVERFLSAEDAWLDQVGRSVVQLSANINRPCVIGVAPAAGRNDTKVGRSFDAIQRAFDAGDGRHGGGATG